jgi:hypothetical protein
MCYIGTFNLLLSLLTVESLTWHFIWHASNKDDKRLYCHVRCLDAIVMGNSGSLSETFGMVWRPTTTCTQGREGATAPAAPFVSTTNYISCRSYSKLQNPLNTVAPAKSSLYLYFIYELCNFLHLCLNYVISFINYVFLSYVWLMWFFIVFINYIILFAKLHITYIFISIKHYVLYQLTVSQK